jgi:S-adenosyl methyltransferase
MRHETAAQADPAGPARPPRRASTAKGRASRPTARAAAGGFDPKVPNVARVYDFVLGGKDNFAADRAFAEEVIRRTPDFPVVVRANRAYLGRVVRHLAADCGIDQFLDIGTGLPTAENVHQVACRVNPASRVVYVDNDPVVLTHARALLADNSNVAVARGDVRDPAAILATPQVQQLIDFSRPVAVLMVAILHFVTDEHRPYDIVAQVRDQMVPGSYLAISHGEYRERLVEGAALYSRANEPAVLRSRPEIARFFDGFELIEPGLVPVSRWRHDADVAGAEEVWFTGGVGRR